MKDENGNPVRHPVRMSDFEERPRFYLSRQENLSQEQIRKSFSETSGSGREGITVSTLKSLIFKELIGQMQAQVSGNSLDRNKKHKIKGRLRKRKTDRRL